MCFLCIVAKIFNTFPCQYLPNLQQASILGESCADPCPKLQIWGMDKCLEIPWDGCSPTLFKWTQSDKRLSILFSVVISLPWMLIPCKYTVLPSFLQWFCTCDNSGRGHWQSRFVTHFVLHKMSQCIEKVGDRRYALWECQLYMPVLTMSGYVEAFL